MLAIPVATTIRLVAASSRPALLRASRRTDSGNQIAAKPNRSSSRAASWAFAAGCASSVLVQMPIGPSFIEIALAINAASGLFFVLSLASRRILVDASQLACGRVLEDLVCWLEVSYVL